MTDTKQVKLSKPITYAYKGENVEASFITLLPPTAKHIHLTGLIKSVFQKNAVEFRQNQKLVDQVADAAESQQKEGGEKEVGSDDVWGLFYMNPDSIEQVMIAGKELMSSGLFLIEGEVKLTKPLIDELSTEDFEKVLGEFMANFIVASLM